MKHLWIHKFPFKNVIFLAIESKMYLKIQQKLRYLTWISKQTMRSAVKKTKRQFLDEKLPFLHKKKKKAFFWMFSFHFSSFNGVLLTLKCRTLVLKPPHGDRTAAILLKNDLLHESFQIW